ncbi:MAG: KH domain-containing protein [Clostridia bacterium]|nr:KH domain-containing protein [Clostridia bacterium]
MKEILELIITNLVENKQEVSIEEIAEDKVVTYKVKVSKDDMGRVIGKQGRVAKSIRTVMKSVSAKEGKKVNIDFVD